MINKIAAYPKIQNPLVNYDDLPDSATVYAGNIYSTIITILFFIAFILFVIVFMLGAIKWITSGGDKGRADSARNTITSAVVGLVVVLSLFAAIGIIQIIFGVSLLSFDLTNIILGS